MSYYWNDRYFNDCRALPYYEPNWSYRYGYRHPRVVRVAHQVAEPRCYFYAPVPAPEPIKTPAPEPVQEPAPAPEPVKAPEPAPEPTPELEPTPEPVKEPVAEQAAAPEPEKAPQAPAKPCIETVVIPGDCLRRTNSFVQLTETKCEVRDHDQYDCTYDYKFTEAGDNKSIVKSHKSQISNMSKSMSNMSNYFAETPTTTVEVKPITYAPVSSYVVPRYRNYYYC